MASLTLVLCSFIILCFHLITERAFDKEVAIQLRLFDLDFYAKQVFGYQFKCPVHICIFTLFLYVGGCMCVCVSINGGGCDTFVIVCTHHPGPQVLLSKSGAFHTLLLSGSRVATPSLSSTSSLPSSPKGVSPSWRAGDQAEPWEMPPEELWGGPGFSWGKHC